ncbi:MAG TPA: polysaccharide deacetylase [Candidatus Limnocylindrales bacterium]|nr:polysaccharide deacetylase [Candidatus Limnocylindrales bacterium]
MTRSGPPDALLPPGFRWPDGVRAAATFTFDLDAEAAMLADHPETAAYLDVMAHQRYGPRTAVPRLLRLLDRRGVRATFFIPGWVAEQWPAAARTIRDAGHEIAHHGYLHESVRGMDAAAEERALVRGLEALDAVLGVRPVGYRAPSWDLNWGTPALLAGHGFTYSSNLMDADHPYRLAVGPEPGAATLVELPVHWGLDDWEPYNYLPGITGTGAILSPSAVLERWTLELEALAAEGGLFNLTNHPFVSGRASRAVALEELIRRAQAIDGVWVATCGEIAAWTATLDLEPVVHERPALPS